MIFILNILNINLIKYLLKYTELIKLINISYIKIKISTDKYYLTINIWSNNYSIKLNIYN